MQRFSEFRGLRGGGSSRISLMVYGSRLITYGPTDTFLMQHLQLSSYTYGKEPDAAEIDCRTFRRQVSCAESVRKYQIRCVAKRVWRGAKHGPRKKGRGDSRF